MNEQNRKKVNTERWTPGLLRLEALERKLEAIESFLWAESGYAPNVPNTTPTWAELLRRDDDGQITGVRIDTDQTVAPVDTPKQKGRAGEGVRELSREEQVAILYPDGHDKSRALAQAKDLHDYCNRNGFEGIGHSIGLLVAELERDGIEGTPL